MRRAAAVSRATAMRRPHREMRGAATMWATPYPTAAHREMWCSAAMRNAAVKCRTTVERGRASAERRSAMGCGRAMEPRPPRNAGAPWKADAPCNAASLWDAAAPSWIAVIAPGCRIRS